MKKEGTFHVNTYDGNNLKNRFFGLKKAVGHEGRWSGVMTLLKCPLTIWELLIKFYSAVLASIRPEQSRNQIWLYSFINID